MPPPEAPVVLDPSSGRLRREGRAALDDPGAVGVELALRLADAAGGADVVLLSMTPAGDLSGLRSALAMGAHRAVVVSDEGLAGADSLTTAKVLAAAARRAGPVDLVVAGTESTDGYTGVLACQLATLLGLPAVTFARSVAISDPDGVLRAERQTEHGIEDVECPLPCLLTVTSGAVAPRYPSYKAIVGARTKPIDVVAPADLSLSLAASATQEVVAAASAERRVAGEVVDDEGQGHERIVELLVRLKVL